MAKPRSIFANRQVPLYYQLENLLRERINSGKFVAGDRLPTESDLIEQYQVSRITVRQALGTLAAEGLIERRQGRGTFVAERRTRKRHLDGNIHLTGSLDELIEMGLEIPVKMIEIHQVEADQHEADFLQIKVGEPIYRLKRMRLRDGKPYSLIVNYLPSEIGTRLTREELSSGALLQTIETRLGYRLRDARQQVKAELADPYVANLLEVRIGTPLLSIERTVYTDKGQPVEYAHTLYRSDLHSYSVYLTRDPDKFTGPAHGRKK